MKKLFAGLCVTFLVAVMSLGLSSSAHAADYSDNTDEGTAPSTVTSGGGAEADAGTADSGAGILPNTGGPETLLLVGGAALIAVGGVALVTTRRRRA